MSTDKYLPLKITSGAVCALNLISVEYCSYLDISIHCSVNVPMLISFFMYTSLVSNITEIKPQRTLN